MAENLWELRHDCVAVFSSKVEEEDDSQLARLKASDSEVVGEEEVALLTSLQSDPEDVASRNVYADWLDEQGLVFAALSHRLRIEGYRWNNTTGNFFSFLSPHEHVTLVNRVLGMVHRKDAGSKRAAWWSLAPSSLSPEENWELAEEDFNVLTAQLAAGKPAAAEFRGHSDRKAIVLNILGVAQFWDEHRNKYQVGE